MNKKISHLLAFFLCGILLTVLFTGCINQEQKPAVSTEIVLPEAQLDQPSVLPNWTDGEYHDYYRNDIDIVFNPRFREDNPKLNHEP